MCCQSSTQAVEVRLRDLRERQQSLLSRVYKRLSEVDDELSVLDALRQTLVGFQSSACGGSRAVVRLRRDASLGHYMSLDLLRKIRSCRPGADPFQDAGLCFRAATGRVVLQELPASTMARRMDARQRLFPRPASSIKTGRDTDDATRKALAVARDILHIKLDFPTAKERRVTVDNVPVRKDAWPYFVRHDAADLVALYGTDLYSLLAHLYTRLLHTLLVRASRTDRLAALVVAFTLPHWQELQRQLASTTYGMVVQCEDDDLCSTTRVRRLQKLLRRRHAPSYSAKERLLVCLLLMRAGLMQRFHGFTVGELAALVTGQSVTVLNARKILHTRVGGFCDALAEVVMAAADTDTSHNDSMQINEAELSS